MIGVSLNHSVRSSQIAHDLVGRIIKTVQESPDDKS